MKLLHSSDLQSLNYIQNIEQQYITGAKVPCSVLQIVEQCLAYIEEYDQEGVKKWHQGKSSIIACVLAC